jgi:putative redox protein
MKARIKWTEGAMFVGEAGSGHCVVMDGPADGGGRNLGVRPMEMLLLGTGACSAYDVVHILRKGRHDITDCIAEVAAERAAEEPKVFTRIHIHFIVTGRGLNPAVVGRAVALSAEKYCSASIMMARAGVEVSHDYEIVDVEASSVGGDTSQAREGA